MSHSCMWVGNDTLGLCQCNFGRPSQCRDCQNARSTKYCSKTCNGVDNYSSPTECRIKLHWLPVRAWIQYKILLLVYKCVQRTAPTYLQELINVNTYDRVGLCSSQDDCKLQIPRVNRETFANRSFKVVGPRW